MSQALIGTFLNWLATGLTIEEGLRSITHDGSKVISDRGIPHLSEVIDYEDVPDDIEMYVSEADEYIAQYHNELHDTILTSEHRNHFIETFYNTHPECRIHRSITDYYLNHYLDQLEAALKSGTTLYDLFISKQIYCAQETANDIKKTVNEIKDRQNIAEKDFYRRMIDSFTYEREQHPSIRMMKTDPDLFPKGLPEILSDRRHATEKDEPPRTIKEMILESWKRQERKHILLIGEGGIGKTVAMLTLPEESWFKALRIPVIYVPLQRLDVYEGDLSRYIQEKTGRDYSYIIELANRIPDGRPYLILLLDGFNEIPDKYKVTAAKFIREWMHKAGVQIITTSRLGFSLENKFSKYLLQTLPYETVKSFLLTAEIKEEKLPEMGNKIWKIINIPLMLTIYTQIEKVKEITDSSSLSLLLDWKDPDNAAHIIWDYLQMEIYRCVDKSDESYSPIQYAMAILAIAPYICCQMSYKRKYYLGYEELLNLILDSLSLFSSHQSLLDRQIINIRRKFDRDQEIELFGSEMAPEYLRILVENMALFQQQEHIDRNKELIYTYSLVHQNFRDALAAFFICSCMSEMSGKEEKTTVLDYADYYVKNYIAEHFSEKELIKIWNRHRMKEPEDGHITWILMDLIGRQNNYDYRYLDFGNIDLTKTNIHMLISRRLDICPLPRNKENMCKVRVSLKCILPKGHSGWVNSVAFSPDGRKLASGSADKTVRIWNLESGECQVLEGHSDKVNSLAYNPDGNQVVSASDDKTLRIWNLESGECRVLEGHSDKVNTVAYSPDGKQLVSGSDDKTLRIWNLENRKCYMIEGHTGRVNSVAFSWDGKLVISGSSDNTICVRNLESGETHVLKVNSGGIRSVSFCPDGRHVISGSTDKTLRIWNLDDRKIHTIKGYSGGMRSVSFILDGEYVKSRSTDMTLQSNVLESWESRILEYHERGINSVACSLDGRQIVSGSSDMLLRIHDLESGENSVLEGHTGRIRSVAFSPDGRQIASGSTDMTVRIWNLESGESRVLEGYTGEVKSVAYSQDGMKVACGSTDKTVRIWDLESGRSHVLSGHTGWVRSVKFSPGGKYCASSSSDRTIRIWNMESTDSILIEGHVSGIDSVTYSPDGRQLASGSDDKTVRIWDLESRKCCVFEGHTGWVRHVTYSPDGRQLASGSDDKTVRIWDLESGKSCVLEGHDGWVNCVAFSPDGKKIAVASGKKVYIWDLESGEKRELVGHLHWVNSVAYNPDGKEIASGSFDKTIRIWNLKSGKSFVIEGNRDSVSSLAYSPDGKQLVSGSYDRTVRIWDLKKRQEVKSYIVTPHINLNGANFELSTIDDDEKIYLIKAGAKVN